MALEWTLRRKLLVWLLIVVAAAVVAIGVPAIHTPLLRSAGRALVVDEPVTTADLIVVSIDANVAGLLEAADLVHDGISTRVALFADPLEAADREFLRRGVGYEEAGARAVRQLSSLGVSNIEELPRVQGTDEAARVLSEWCTPHGIRSIVVVSGSDHSRRLRRVLGRAMDGRGVSVHVRASRYTSFDPERWWETRNGLRTGIFELQKLLLDIARHPF